MPDEKASIESLARQVQQLAHQVGVLEDTQAIRTLQFKYGYYMDKCMFEEVIDLYADDAELHFMGSIYRGKAGLRRLYVGRLGGLFTQGHNGPVDGFLSDYLQLQDIVDVAPDRQSARGRFRYFMQGGNHASRSGSIRGLPQQWWESGVYENVYVKEGGIWRIGKLGLHLAWRADHEKGWRHADPGVSSAPPRLFPEDPLGPDEFIAGRAATWPKAAIHPFHYPHPVTGKAVP
jgi:hypothetical protein